MEPDGARAWTVLRGDRGAGVHAGEFPGMLQPGDLRDG